MYPDEYITKRRPKKHFKTFIIAVSLVLLIFGAIGGVLAYLSASTESLNNNFEYTYVTCQVEEQFDANTKSNVTVKNTGNIPAYIRASVIITWKDAEGNVYGKTPTPEKDYTISFSDNWTKNGDYFYCNLPVAPNSSAPALIEECTEISANRPADGYALSVEIIADAIQSEPANAVNSAWSYIPQGN